MLGCCSPVVRLWTHSCLRRPPCWLITQESCPCPAYPASLASPWRPAQHPEGMLFVTGNLDGPQKHDCQRTGHQVPDPSSHSLGETEAQKGPLPRVTLQGQGRGGLQSPPPDTQDSAPILSWDKRTHTSAFQGKDIAVRGHVSPPCWVTLGPLSQAAPPVLTHPGEKRQQSDLTESAARLDKGQPGWTGGSPRSPHRPELEFPALAPSPKNIYGGSCEVASCWKLY